MKKSHIIIGIAILGLIAFGFVCNYNPMTQDIEPSTSNSFTISNEIALNSNLKPDSDFFFGLGTRFNSIKKEKLVTLKSFNDLIGKEHIERIVSYKSLSVTMLKKNEEKGLKLSTNSGVFSEAQLQLLQSANYNTNLLIAADYKEDDQYTGKVEDNSWTPYLTVVPETQAYYINGKEALIDYLQQYTKEETIVLPKDLLKPGKLYFTVTKEGNISNIEIVSTSGFPMVDEKIKILISKLPGKWQPAKDSNGTTVDQTLVISFGNMGC